MSQFICRKKSKTWKQDSHFKNATLLGTDDSQLEDFEDFIPSRVQLYVMHTYSP